MFIRPAADRFGHCFPIWSRVASYESVYVVTCALRTLLCVLLLGTEAGKLGHWTTLKVLIDTNYITQETFGSFLCTKSFPELLMVNSLFTNIDEYVPQILITQVLHLTLAKLLVRSV